MCLFVVRDCLDDKMRRTEVNMRDARARRGSTTNGRHDYAGQGCIQSMHTLDYWVGLV